MPAPSDGEISVVGFLALLLVLSAILWLACPDDREPGHEGFDPGEDDHGLR